MQGWPLFRIFIHMNGNPKVALVHDWLVGMRGGEKVLEVLCELFPRAVLFTLAHRPGSVSPVIDEMDIRTSFIEYLPGGLKHYQYYLLLYPSAIRSFDLRPYDLVISSSHAAAKGVRVRHDALHICYCHTPMRYIWDQYEQYFGPGRSSLPVRVGMKFFREYLRRWDVATARKVDYFIANSKYVGDRIRRIYDRSSVVIFPPVDVNAFRCADGNQGYFLVVSALVPYKRIDIAVKAFTTLGIPLVIAGSGSEEAKLKRLAGSNIRFTGYVPDAEIHSLYEGCRALVFPGEEDFGIVPVEAMSCGKPVLAYGRGGACETVVAGKTGLFFSEQSPESLAGAVADFERREFNAEAIRAHAMQFSRERFRQQISAFVSEKLTQQTLR